MKKIITILSIFGAILISGCEGPMGPRGFNGADGFDGLIAEVFELNNVDFDYNAIDGYNIYQTLNPQIFDSDVILIYRLDDIIDANTPIWRLVPQTIRFTNDDEVYYDFDFSREDFKIYAGGNYDLSTTPEYIDNQTFRIVIVPGSFSKTLKSTEYDAVMKTLNIDESQIQKIDF